MQIKDFPISPTRIKLFWKNSLYRNAIFLIAGNSTGALLGFVFWAIASRLYSVEDVGIASAMIAALPLIGILGNLGLEIGIIRYLPNSGKQAENMINASLTITVICTVIVSIIFIFGISLWSPDLMFLKENIIYFILFVVFTTATALSSIVDNTFVAERHSGYMTVKSIVFNVLKVLLLILLAFIMKSYGIFNAWGIALVIAVLVGLFFFIPKLRRGYFPHPSFRWFEISGLLRYSLLNNTAYFLWNVTGRILPMLIISLLGAEDNGYFYIAWTIAATIAFIPTSLSNSLFAEGSNEEKGLETKTIRSLSLVLLIMVPIFIVIILFGNMILKIFGASYAANATSLLKLLVLAQFPLSVNQIYFGLLRIQKKLKSLIILGGTIAVLTTAISYWLLPIFGIVGIGIGWLSSQSVTALWILSKQHWWKPLLRQTASLLIQRKNTNSHE